MGGKEKRWFLLFFAGWWMTVFTLGAQAISGTLKDNNNAPLSYANVVVMTTDSFFVDGGVIRMEVFLYRFRLMIIIYLRYHLLVSKLFLEIVRLVP